MPTTIESSLSVLFDASVRSLFLAASALVVLLLLRIRNRNVHHRAWSIVMVAMLSLPILQWLLPALTLQMPMQARWLTNQQRVEASNPQPTLQTSPVTAFESENYEIVTPSATKQVVTRPTHQRATLQQPESATLAQEEAGTSRWKLLFYLYLAGLIVGLVRLCVGIWKVNRLVQSGERVYSDMASQAPTLQSSAVSIPLTVGVLHPVILLPSGWRTWQPEMLQAVLEHEQTHIDRRDYLIGLLAELNRSLYWFHPLAWWLRKKLATLAEQVCDDLVLSKLENRTNYAEYLLKIATRIKSNRFGNISLGVPMARTSQLESRIDAILDFARPLAKRLSLRGTLLLLAVALPVTAFLAAVQAEETASPEKNVATSKDAKPEDAVAEEAPKFEMSKTIRVVNPDGEPIVGATVTPWAIRAMQGHGPWQSTGMGESEPPILKTDDHGVAIIPFPRYSNSKEKVRPEALTCRVEHSDYADTAYNDVPVTENQLEKITTIKMLPGALVEVEAITSGEKLSANKLFALVSDTSSSGKGLESDKSGRVKLPRISAGIKLIRLVHLPDDGTVFLSDIQQVNLADGDEIKLKFAMKPTITVRGQIDDSVARPVTNGRVVGQVIDLASRDSINRADGPPAYDRPASLQWQVSTKINADGSFILKDVPNGKLQVIALCDGHRAASAEHPPEFVSSQEVPFHPNGPQVFSVDEKQTEIRLRMTPTAECKIAVIGPDQQPVEDASCYSWPNVTWWYGGSQAYCHPVFSTAEAMRNPARVKELLAKHMEIPYVAKTNADGIAILKALPVGDNMLFVGHDDYELPIEPENAANGMRGYRYRNVTLTPGKPTDVLVTMQPKGSEFLESVS